MSWLKAKPLSISCPPSNNVKRILLDSLNKKTSLPEIESKFPKAFLYSNKKSFSLSETNLVLSFSPISFSYLL